MLAVTRIRADILRGAERLVGPHALGMARPCVVSRMHLHVLITVLHLLWSAIGRQMARLVAQAISRPMVPRAWLVVGVCLGCLAWLLTAATT